VLTFLYDACKSKLNECKGEENEEERKTIKKNRMHRTKVIKEKKKRKLKK
jgi:hypothetical protein